MAAKAGSIPSAHTWLGSEEGGKIIEVRKGVAETAEKAIAEFDKVRRLKLEARERSEDIAKRSRNSLARWSGQFQVRG